jgi:hypothetical protein
MYHSHLIERNVQVKRWKRQMKEKKNNTRETEAAEAVD